MRGNDLTITVDKTALLEALRENRAKHGKAFEKAKAGYIKVTMKQLEEYINQLANGDTGIARFVNAPPEDHTGDYDDAIDMMEWSTDDTIELSQSQFVQYVKDDWGWKQSWTVSNSEYLQA